MSEHTQVPKRRLGVVLAVPDPIATEIDGMRRALGQEVGRIAPHITLVPPVNVRDDRLDAALDAVRTAAAAAGTAPLVLTLGPPATFLPANPVVYLDIRGDGGARQALHALRDRVFVPPLARALTWPFVPHVTLAEEAAPERIAAALEALASYECEVQFDRVHVLEEVPGRRWEVLADYPMAAPAVIGRGGLPVELTVSDHPDPASAPPRSFAVTARREGAPVGSAVVALEGDDHAVLVSLHVVEHARGQGVGRHLLAMARSEAARRGAALATRT